MGLKEWSEKTRANAEQKKMLATVKKVSGKPWWEQSVSQFVCEYKDLDQLNGELAIASPLGWYIDDTTGDGGHINVGRTASAAVLTGGLSLIFGASRSKKATTVTWKRDT